MNNSKGPPYFTNFKFISINSIHSSVYINTRNLYFTHFKLYLTFRYTPCSCCRYRVYKSTHKHKKQAQQTHCKARGKHTYRASWLSQFDKALDTQTHAYLVGSVSRGLLLHVPFRFGTFAPLETCNKWGISNARSTSLFVRNKYLLER